MATVQNAIYVTLNPFSTAKARAIVGGPTIRQGEVHRCTPEDADRLAASFPGEIVRSAKRPVKGLIVERAAHLDDYVPPAPPAPLVAATPAVAVAPAPAVEPAPAAPTGVQG